jgi:hypothetical protein
LLHEWLLGSIVTPDDFQASPTSLLFMAAALLITIGTDALRRYINHRLDMWQGRNPVPKPEEDSDGEA